MVDWNKLNGSQKQIMLDAVVYVFVEGGSGLAGLNQMLGVMDVSSKVKANPTPNNQIVEYGEVISRLQLYGGLEKFVSYLQSQFANNGYVAKLADMLRAADNVPANVIVAELGWNNTKGDFWLQGLASGAGWSNFGEFLTRLAGIGDHICLVEIPKGTPRGSGILIGPSTILTNYHVVEDIVGTADPDAAVTFDYKSDTGGASGGTRVAFHAGAPSDWLKHSSPAAQGGAQCFDFAVIELEEAAPPKLSGAPRSPAPLDAPLYALQNRPLVIAHHPGGAPLAISLGSSLGVADQGRRLKYNPDTKDGSSGGGVYNAKLELVALHHAAYVPAPGQGWNQGIPVSAIRAAMHADG